MAFSGALTLTDLNDFITPSQACIKPVQETNKPTERDAGAAATEIHIDGNGSYYEVTPLQDKDTNKGQKLEQAQISLNDCLACSGCITSAESVLITLQSHIEVLSVLSNGTDERIPIISIAPQSLASLAAAHPPSPTASPTEWMTPREIFQRTKEFCTSVLGFAYVFDTTFARHLALKEHVEEFLERRRNIQQEQELVNGDSAEVLPLPMLTSACPGWICYAEKAHSEVLPFIARTKSPQQVMGTLVKKWIGKRLGKRPDEVYHVSVMPCYDKKLEASRQDFYDDIFKTRDVDCVITTGELELMMKEFGWDIGTGLLSQRSTSPSIPVRKNLPIKYLPQISIPELLAHPGTSSGSYLHAILNSIISTSPVPLTLSVKAIRNADYEEYTLREAPPSQESVLGPEVPGGRRDKSTSRVVFKGIKCYGFRNLQNIVRKVGRERGVRIGAGAAGRLGSTPASGVGAGKGVRKLRATRKGRNADTTDGKTMAGEEGEGEEKRFDYVEVMACPGGCVNGGGQLRPPVLASTVVDLDAEGYKREWDGEGVAPSVGGRWGDREWTKKVEEAYWLEREGTGKSEAVDELADRIVEELCAGDDAEKKRVLRTEYRAVESETIGLAVKW